MILGGPKRSNQPPLVLSADDTSVPSTKENDRLSRAFG